MSDKIKQMSCTNLNENANIKRIRIKKIANTVYLTLRELSFQFLSAL
jgi:hypothetical protein